MNKGIMLPVILVIAVSLGFAVPVQADLIGLTLILTAVWTSGVVVNEAIISPDNQEEYDAAQNDDGSSLKVAAQTQSD